MDVCYDMLLYVFIMNKFMYILVYLYSSKKVGALSPFPIPPLSQGAHPPLPFLAKYTHTHSRAHPAIPHTPCKVRNSARTVQSLHPSKFYLLKVIYLNLCLNLYSSSYATSPHAAAITHIHVRIHPPPTNIFSPPQREPALRRRRPRPRLRPLAPHGAADAEPRVSNSERPRRGTPKGPSAPAKPRHFGLNRAAYLQ